jgi:flagellar motor component MotA
MFTSLQAKAMTITSGITVWLGAVFSSNAPTQEGMQQVADNWPLLVTVGGGIVAAVIAAVQVVKLYDSMTNAIRKMIREELKGQKLEDAQTLNEILRRVSEIESIVDSRRKPQPPPYSVKREG